MDLHALSRRDLQALAKRNGVKANQTNAAMAHALAALPKIDGIEEYVQPASASKPAVQAVAEEEDETAPEEQEAAAKEEERVALTPDEVIVLDDEEEEKAPAVAIGRRRPTRRAPVEPVAAPAAASKRAAAGNTEKENAAVEAVPARPTRGRGQRTVAEEDAPKATARRTSRRAGARSTGTEQEEQEKGTQADVSDVEAAAPAPASSDAGDDGAEDMETVTDAQNEEQLAAAEAQNEDTAAEAVPARTTRGRSQRTVVSAAEDEAPKARRTSRRAAATKTGTDHEAKGGVSEVEAAVPAPADGAAKMEAAMDAQNEEQCAASKAEKGDASAVVVPARATRAGRRRTVVSFAEEAAPKTRRTSRRANGDVCDKETAVPAPVTPDEGGDGAEEMEVAPVAHNEEQNKPVEEPVEAEPKVAVTAPTTRTRSKKRVSFADEEVPKSGRTSRREMEVAMDAHNEEQNEPAEEPVEAEPKVAVTVPTTRTRSKKTVSFADDEVPKSSRTSRRAVANKTSSEQEKEGKVTQGDVSDMEAAVSAPASSDEGGNRAEQFAVAEAVPARATRAPASSDEGGNRAEQFAVAEAVPARATRARRQRKVVSVAVEEAPKARRASRRTARMQEEEVQGQQKQDIASVVEAVVPAPVSSDVGSKVAEEMEADMEPQNKEQNELVEEQSDEGVVQDRTPLLEEQQPVAEDCEIDSSVVDPVAEDCPVDSSLEEPTDTVSSEEIQHSNEDKEMVSAEEVEFTSDASEENEDAEEEPAVAEHIDSSVQEPLVDVQLCEATEEIHLASEDVDMVPVDEATLTSGEATEEAYFTSDAGHDNEENEDCMAEEETPVADDVDSLVQELPVEVQQCEVTEGIQLASEDNEECTVEEELAVAEVVQQCEATEEIHLASEDVEMVPLDKATLTSGEATEEASFTSDAGHDSEENEDCTVEEQTPVADDVDSLVQELPVEVQQCEATEGIQLASEDKEDCTVDEELAVAEVVQQCEATEEIHHASEDVEMVPVDEATLTSGEATEEAYFTSDAGHDGEENDDNTVEEETPVAGDVGVQQCEATEGIQLTSEDEVCTVDEELAVAGDVEVQQCEATEGIQLTSEDEDCTVDEELAVAEDVQQCEATEDVNLAGEDTEMVHVTEQFDFASDADEENEVLPTYEEVATKASENIEDIAADEVTNTTDVAAEEENVHANEENEVPTSEDVLQSAAKANEKKEDIAAEEETLVATAEVSQRSEAMDVGLVEVVTAGNLSQDTVTDDETTVEQSDFSCVLADVSLDEGVVAGDSAADSSVEEQHDTAPSEEIQPSSDDTEMVIMNDAPQATLTFGEAAEEEAGFTSKNVLQSVAKAKMEKEYMVAAEVQQWSEAMYEEVVTVDKDETGFIADLTDVFMDEEAAVAADEMPQQSSATMEEVVSIENLPQATDDEWAVTLGAWLENLSRAKVTEDEGAVEEVVTVEEIVTVEKSGVTLQPAFDAATEFSDHVASPLSANVFEDATKYLTMDTVKPTVSEPVDVPLCVHRQSDRQMKITEPMSVQVKVAKKPEALGSLSRRRLKMKFKADDAPLCIYSACENDVKENNESEALGSLSLRKLRTEFNEIVAVAQENGVKEGKKSSAQENRVKEDKKSSVPLDALSLRQLRLKLRETLNAQNQKSGEPTRVPLGRLDENAY